MNVFDSEMGPLTDQDTAKFLIILAEAGCTPQEAAAAMKRLTGVVN